MFPQTTTTLPDAARLSRCSLLSKLNLTYIYDNNNDDEDIDIQQLDSCLCSRKQTKNTKPLDLKGGTSGMQGEGIGPLDTDSDDESDHWKQMSEFMSPLGNTFEMELQHRNVFVGSPLLAVMWDEWPLESLYAREALLVSALRIDRLHDVACATSSAYLPFIYFQALVQASQTASLPPGVSSLLRRQEESPTKPRWESAEKSCKLLQLALPGFPVEKHLLAQLMIGERSEMSGTGSKLPTSIVIIQALLESYKSNLPEGVGLSNLVMHEMQARLSLSQHGRSPYSQSYYSEPETEDEQDQNDEDKTPQSPLRDLSVLGSGQYNFDQWLSEAVDLLEALHERPCLSEVADSIKQLIYEKLMIMETNLFGWVGGIGPDFTTQTLSRAGYLQRPLSSLNFLEDVTFLKELTDLATTQPQGSHEILKYVRRHRKIHLKRASPFNAKFWEKMETNAFGTRQFKETFLVRVSEYESIKRSLRIQRRHFDREFSWVLKMVLSSLSSQMNTQAN